MAMLDSMQLRESYGTGVINYTGRPFVRLEEYRPSDRVLERVRSRLEEQLREQLHEQLYNSSPSLLNTHNEDSETTRGGLSSYLYHVEQEPSYERSPFDSVNTEMFSFEMDNSSSNAEFKSALLDEVQNMSAKYGLERREVMIILNLEGYEMLVGAGNLVSHFMDIEIHVSYDQIELYKVIVKGMRGRDIALMEMRKLR